MRCVGGTSKKYALNTLALPSLWPVQKRTYLIQIEVVALEEVGFLLSIMRKGVFCKWPCNSIFELQ
jgi:hypothetical protein